MIDGTCNATITRGCGNVPPTVKVGNGAGVSGIAVDVATDTIYVANTADDTVSAIDGATCNGSDTAGCNQSPPHVAVGRPSFGGIAVDPASDLVCATNGFDDTVSIIDGAPATPPKPAAATRPRRRFPAEAARPLPR